MKRVVNMQSKDVAAWLISHHGNDAELSNLVLNKLCFYAQVESLKRDGLALFSDAIEAWEYGPVCPNVYHEYKRFGRQPVRQYLGEPPSLTDREQSVLEILWRDYGWLSGYDLVRLSHQPGGAWSKAYRKDMDVRIDDGLILHSADIKGFDPEFTLVGAIKHVTKKYKNTLRLLENT